MDRIQAAIEKARAEREARLSSSEAAPPPVADQAPPARAVTPLRTVLRQAPQSPAPVAEIAPAPASGSVPEARPPVGAPPAQAGRDRPQAPRFHIADPQPAWDALPDFAPDPHRLRRQRIVTLDRGDRAQASYALMRTRLLQFCRSNGWRSVMVTSPTGQCGKTTTCLNLAFSLAQQQDVRTALLDFDLRAPSVAPMLGIETPRSIVRFLERSASLADSFVRCGGLAIGTQDAPYRYAAELLQDRRTGEAIAELTARLAPDVILYDMPAMKESDDVLAFLPQVDCVLLVAAAETTTAKDLDRYERELGSQTNVLGIVLNKCRYMGKG